MATALETAKDVLELQQGGHRLVKRLKEVREEQQRDIQSKIDMLKQESHNATKKVRQQRKQQQLTQQCVTKA